MVIKCCVAGCKNRTNTTGCSFHGFPKNEMMRAKWLHNLNMPSDLVPRANVRVCSGHFQNKDFTFNPDYSPEIRFRRLLEGAVPVISTKAQDISKNPLDAAECPPIKIAKDKPTDKQTQTFCGKDSKSVQCDTIWRVTRNAATQTDMPFMLQNPEYSVVPYRVPAFNSTPIIKQEIKSEDEESFETDREPCHDPDTSRFCQHQVPSENGFTLITDTRNSENVDQGEESVTDAGSQVFGKLDNSNMVRKHHCDTGESSNTQKRRKRKITSPLKSQWQIEGMGSRREKETAKQREASAGLNAERMRLARSAESKFRRYLRVRMEAERRWRSRSGRENAGTPLETEIGQVERYVSRLSEKDSGNENAIIVGDCKAPTANKTTADSSRRTDHTKHSVNPFLHYNLHNRKYKHRGRHWTSLLAYVKKPDCNRFQTESREQYNVERERVKFESQKQDGVKRRLRQQPLKLMPYDPAGDKSETSNRPVRSEAVGESSQRYADIWQCTNHGETLKSATFRDIFDQADQDKQKSISKEMAWGIFEHF